MNAIRKQQQHRSSLGHSKRDDDSNGAVKSNIKECLSSTHHTIVDINNVQIHFPFRPYNVQVTYMKSVLNALQRGEHALLESPTGTGKTLCLLCSALAWQQAERGRICSTAVDDISSKLEDPKLSSILEKKVATTKIPVIIYASRTHSQLSQVVRQLKTTRYRPKHAVLGSREHMCIHPKINPQSVKAKNCSSNSSSNPSDVNHGCTKLNKERKCVYRNHLDEVSGNKPWTPPANELGPVGDSFEQPVLDIEDLVAVGKQHRICPFFHTKSLIKDAEIIFVPYNYLFDRSARETSLAEVNFTNAILIFDEAHNLEEFASESSSFDLSSADVAGCVGEVQRALQYLDISPEMGEACKMKDNLLRLKSLFLRFEQYLLNRVSNTSSNQKPLSEKESSHPGDFIFDIFQEGAGITHANHGIFISFVRQVGDLIIEHKGNSFLSSSGTPKLDHFVNCLQRAFGDGTELLAMARSKSYRVHVTKIQSNENNGGGGFVGGRIISYWCFAPALAMRELAFLNVRSILITSGTLSPMTSFSLELGLEFPNQLENDHVIQADQIYVRVIGKGVSGKELTSKFGRRDDPEYIQELGNTVASLCRNIPGGVLVFFPSYNSMQTCVERWGGPSPSRGKSADKGRANFFASRKRQSSSTKYSFPQTLSHFLIEESESASPWKRILSKKAIVLEPRTASDLNDAIAEFKSFITMPKSTGCILMGVCRGKISEGIDFSDDMCRAVIVTGLPFAPYLDPKVQLKREFLDSARASERARPSDDGGFGSVNSTMNKNTSVYVSLSGAEWYNQQAHRAVNQAIGRVIRHRNDYGAVLLLDNRFAERRNSEGLSKWMRSYLRDESLGACTRGLVQFYRECVVKASKEEPKYGCDKNNPGHYKKSDDSEQFTQVAVVECRDFEPGDEIPIPIRHPKKRLISKEPCNSVSSFFSAVDSMSPTSKVSDETTFNVDVVACDSKKEQKEYLSEISIRTGCTLYNKSASTEPHDKNPQSGLLQDYTKAIHSLKKETNESMLWPIYEYRKNRTPSSQKKSSVNIAENSSTWDILNSKPDIPISKLDENLLSRRGMLKEQFHPSKKSDYAKLQAKAFFDDAKQILVKEDLLKTQQLLVAMKGYGDEDNSQQYIETSRELVSLLVNGGSKYIGRQHIQLVGTLLSLLPLKCRNEIQKFAAGCCFEKTSFCYVCRNILSTEDFTVVERVTPKLLFDHHILYQKSTNTVIQDKIILDHCQKILDILDGSKIELGTFFDLLPERYFMRSKALQIELSKVRDIAEATVESKKFQGEKCISMALFQSSKQKASVSTKSIENIEEADQQNMTHALIQGKTVYDEKKKRVQNFQNRIEEGRKVINPYTLKPRHPSFQNCPNDTI